MTRDEFIAMLADRIASKLRSTQTWSDLVAAVQVASLEDKTKIVDSLKTHGYATAGEVLGDIVSSYLKAAALTEATTIMEDNTMTLTELMRVFGDD